MGNNRIVICKGGNPCFGTDIVLPLCDVPSLLSGGIYPCQTYVEGGDTWWIGEFWNVCDSIVGPRGYVLFGFPILLL